jgi:hypothetical protein
MSLETPDPNIKKITLTGDAAESLNPNSYDKQMGGSKRKSRKAVAIKTNVVKVGGGTSPGTLEQLAASRVPGSNSSKAIGAMSPFTEGAPKVGLVSPALQSAGSSASHANAKVVLAKTRKKILLAPKAALSIAHTAHPVKRKTAKKIRVNISGLGNKLHKAKTIRKRASHKDLAEVKKDLVKAKLIKDDSKAPEEIIRQIYSDYMVLKKRAL